MKQLLITIDGPAGAGKTSGSKMLAQRLGYKYIDTGALYRGVGYFAHANNVAADDDAGLAELLPKITLDFVREDDGGLRLLGSGPGVENLDISEAIRTPLMSKWASDVSARPVVREWLLGQQRRMGDAGGAVFEGRDMGTVVFPHADIKFFITASPEVRAQRRWNEMSLEARDAMGFEELLRQINERDYNDSHREIAPLKPAVDAITIWSDGMTVGDSVDAMLVHIQPLQKDNGL